MVRPVFRFRTQNTCRVFFCTARSSLLVLVLVLKKSSVLNRFQFLVVFIASTEHSGDHEGTCLVEMQDFEISGRLSSFHHFASYLE